MARMDQVKAQKLFKTKDFRDVNKPLGYVTVINVGCTTQLKDQYMKFFSIQMLKDCHTYAALHPSFAQSFCS